MENIPSDTSFNRRHLTEEEELSFPSEHTSAQHTENEEKSEQVRECDSILSPGNRSFSNANEAVARRATPDRVPTDTNYKFRKLPLITRTADEEGSSEHENQIEELQDDPEIRRFHEKHNNDIMNEIAEECQGENNVLSSSDHIQESPLLQRPAFENNVVHSSQQSQLTALNTLPPIPLSPSPSLTTSLPDDVGMSIPELSSTSRTSNFSDSSSYLSSSRRRSRSTPHATADPTSLSTSGYRSSSSRFIYRRRNRSTTEANHDEEQSFTSTITSSSSSSRRRTSRSTRRASRNNSRGPISSLPSVASSTASSSSATQYSPNSPSSRPNTNPNSLTLRQQLDHGMSALARWILRSKTRIPSSSSEEDEETQEAQDFFQRYTHDYTESNSNLILGDEDLFALSVAYGSANPNRARRTRDQSNTSNNRSSRSTRFRFIQPWRNRGRRLMTTPATFRNPHHLQQHDIDAVTYQFDPLHVLIEPSPLIDELQRRNANLNQPSSTIWNRRRRNNFIHQQRIIQHQRQHQPIISSRNTAQHQFRSTSSLPRQQQIHTRNNTDPTFSEQQHNHSSSLFEQSPSTATRRTSRYTTATSQPQPQPLHRSATTEDINLQSESTSTNPNNRTRTSLETRTNFSSQQVARLQWIHINQRLHVIITIVAISFSLILFAILVCWVVLTSAYIMSLDKHCDIPLKQFFWLATIQLLVDIFRTDIMRWILQYDPTRSPPPPTEDPNQIPTRIIIYNIIYVTYAMLVLRLGVKSCFFQPDSNCPKTAPGLYQTSTIFVILILSAWITLLLGYLLPFCLAFILITLHNGRTPTLPPNTNAVTTTHSGTSNQSNTNASHPVRAEVATESSNNAVNSRNQEEENLPVSNSAASVSNSNIDRAVLAVSATSTAVSAASSTSNTVPFTFPSLTSYMTSNNASEIGVEAQEADYTNQLKPISLEDFPPSYPRDCCICMSDFVPGDDIVVTLCEHVFHRGCCLQWLQHGFPTCPVCRKIIVNMDTYVANRISSDENVQENNGFLFSNSLLLNRLLLHYSGVDPSTLRNVEQSDLPLSNNEEATRISENHVLNIPQGPEQLRSPQDHNESTHSDNGDAFFPNENDEEQGMTRDNSEAVVEGIFNEGNVTEGVLYEI